MKEGGSKQPLSPAPLLLPPCDTIIRAKLGCQPFPHQEPPGIPFAVSQDLEGIPPPVQQPEKVRMAIKP